MPWNNKITITANYDGLDVLGKSFTVTFPKKKVFT